MKRHIFYIIVLFLSVLGFNSCKENNYAQGDLSPYIAIIDLKDLYNNADLVLTKQVTKGGAHLMRGIVISKPADGNSMPNTIVVQGTQKQVKRGITLEFTEGAQNYKPGDSIVVEIENTILKKVNGSVRLTGLNPSKVRVASENNLVQPLMVTVADILAAPSNYEGVLLKINSGALDRNIALNETYLGDKPFKDSSGKFVLHTEGGASFASNKLPASASFVCYPIFYGEGADTPVLRFWLRSVADVENPAGPLYPNFPEGWEVHNGTRKAGYSGSSDTFPSGNWLMSGMYTLNSPNIVNKTGDFALMIRDASPLEMNFTLPEGASKLSFYYGAATLQPADSELPTKVKVAYSTNGGLDWIQIGSDLEVTDQTRKYFFETQLNISGPVKFKITKDTSKPRLFIDDFAVYKQI